VKYYGDTIKYYSSGNPQPAVYLERVNANGFLVEYTSFSNGKMFEQHRYEYDGKDNLISKLYFSYSSQDQPYVKYLYYYDDRNLTTAMDYYQNDMTKPITKYKYEYVTTK